MVSPIQLVDFRIVIDSVGDLLELAFLAVLLAMAGALVLVELWALWHYDREIGRGSGFDRLRNSDGNLPGQGMRHDIGLALFVALPIAAALESGQSVLPGLVLCGAFYIWVIYHNWINPI